MKKIIILSNLAFILAACNNIPGQQLYTCTDNYAANRENPSTDVPAPPSSSQQNLCQLPEINEQKQEKAPVQKEKPKQIPQSEIAIGHVYPLSSTVVVCDSTPVCPLSHQEKEQKNPTDECNFDSMPIKKGMNSTEKLNRTR